MSLSFFRSGKELFFFSFVRAAGLISRRFIFVPIRPSRPRAPFAFLLWSNQAFPGQDATLPWPGDGLSRGYFVTSPYSHAAWGAVTAESVVGTDDRRI
jgi:hypothetical protein